MLIISIELDQDLLPNVSYLSISHSKEKSYRHSIRVQCTLQSLLCTRLLLNLHQAAFGKNPTKPGPVLSQMRSQVGVKTPQVRSLSLRLNWAKVVEVSLIVDS